MMDRSRVAVGGQRERGEHTRQGDEGQSKGRGGGGRAQARAGPRARRAKPGARGRTQRDVGQRRQGIFAQVEAVVPALDRAEVLNRLDAEACGRSVGSDGWASDESARQAETTITAGKCGRSYRGGYEGRQSGRSVLGGGSLQGFSLGVETHRALRRAGRGEGRGAEDEPRISSSLSFRGLMCDAARDASYEGQARELSSRAGAAGRVRRASERGPRRRGKGGRGGAGSAHDQDAAHSGCRASPRRERTDDAERTSGVSLTISCWDDR